MIDYHPRRKKNFSFPFVSSSWDFSFPFTSSVSSLLLNLLCFFLKKQTNNGTIEWNGLRVCNEKQWSNGCDLLWIIHDLFAPSLSFAVYPMDGKQGPTDQMIAILIESRIQSFMMLFLLLSSSSFNGSNSVINVLIIDCRGKGRETGQPVSLSFLILVFLVQQSHQRSNNHRMQRSAAVTKNLSLEGNRERI